MRFRLATFPLAGLWVVPPFHFVLVFAPCLAPPATMVACGRVLTLVSLVFAPVFYFNSLLFVSPPRHADDAREGYDGGWSCHSAFFVSPPPHWRYAAGFDGWFAFF